MAYLSHFRDDSSEAPSTCSSLAGFAHIRYWFQECGTVASVAKGDDRYPAVVRFEKVNYAGVVRTACHSDAARQLVPPAPGSPRLPAPPPRLPRWNAWDCSCALHFRLATRCSPATRRGPATRCSPARHQTARCIARTRRPPTTLRWMSWSRSRRRPPRPRPRPRPRSRRRHGTFCGCCVRPGVAAGVGVGRGLCASSPPYAVSSLGVFRGEV